MPQQINLCAPILLTQKKYFSAQTMAVSLGVFLVVGALLGGVWTWNLRSAAAQYTATMESQRRDMASLQSAIDRNKAAALPMDPALSRQVEERRAYLAQRQQLLAALQEGTSEPGKGFSDRLRFLAASLPAQVWITGVSMTTASFQVNGLTLEPSALNDWMARMATHPLLEGLQLSQVQVHAQQKPQAVATGTAVASPATAANLRNAWSFELASTRPVAPKGSEQERKP